MRWLWQVVDGRDRPVSAGTLTGPVEGQEAAYEAMTRFQADRGVPAHELRGLWCVARKSTDPAVVGVVDGCDW